MCIYYRYKVYYLPCGNLGKMYIYAKPCLGRILILHIDIVLAVWICPYLYTGRKYMSRLTLDLVWKLGSESMECAKL